MTSDFTSSLLGESGVTTAVMVAIRRIMRSIDLHSKYLATRYGMTGPQLTVMQALEACDGLSVGALARSVHLSSPTVTGILTRLSKRDLVRQSRGQDDRRVVQIWLTEPGRTLLAQAPPPLQERFRSEFAKLSDWEQTLILSCLQRIVAMMEAKEIDASPIMATGPIDSTAERTRQFLAREAAVSEVDAPPGRRRPAAKDR